MSIQVIWEKLKGATQREDILLSLLIIVVAGVSFYLGRLSSGDVGVVLPQGEDRAEAQVHATTNRIDATITPRDSSARTVPQVAGDSTGVSEGGYVASKSGTKYHLPWCGSAKQIKEENKIWFATKAEAEAAGYTPAANCKGI